MKWQASPTMRPPPASDPASVVRRDRPGIHRQDEGLGFAHRASSDFVFCTCGEKRRLKPTISCGPPGAFGATMHAASQTAHGVDLVRADRQRLFHEHVGRRPAPCSPARRGCRRVAMTTVLTLGLAIIASTSVVASAKPTFAALHDAAGAAGGDDVMEGRARRRRPGSACAKAVARPPRPAGLAALVLRRVGGADTADGVTLAGRRCSSGGCRLPLRSHHCVLRALARPRKRSAMRDQRGSRQPTMAIMSSTARSCAAPSSARRRTGSRALCAPWAS